MILRNNTATASTSAVHAMSTRSTADAPPPAAAAQCPSNTPQSTQPSAPISSLVHESATLATTAGIVSSNVQDQGNQATVSLTPRRTGAVVSHRPGQATGQQWMKSPTFGNVLGAILLVLTVTSLGWILSVGLIGLKLQKWTAKNDALQSCLSWDTAGCHSCYCNETIEAGITRPPLMRRDPALVELVGSYDVTLWAYRLSLITTTTLFIGILTLIYFRPHVELFRPIVSNVRTQPSCPANAVGFNATEKRTLDFYDGGGDERADSKSKRGIGVESPE